MVSGHAILTRSISISNAYYSMLGNSEFMRKWIGWIARGFGAGLSPYAPGTFGTLLGIPIILALNLLPVAGYVIGAMLLVLLSISASSYVSRALEIEDDPTIVIDEIAGFVIAMMFVPISLSTMILGFVFFRLFDIFKPPPANWIDRRFRGGIGITGDDLVAGVYTNIVLQVGLYAL